ncbi:hypothetical protein W04_3439 [Pseudoalteromonas sp. SW0106-04]|nr:hypothetical protein W04_3439 [Pseudoalteromonas sp. SW0106-04]
MGGYKAKALPTTTPPVDWVLVYNIDPCGLGFSLTMYEK